MSKSQKIPRKRINVTDMVKTVNSELSSVFRSTENESTFYQRFENTFKDTVSILVLETKTLERNPYQRTILTSH